MIPTEEAYSVLDIIPIVDALVDCGYEIAISEEFRCPADFDSHRKIAKEIGNASSVILFRHYNSKRDVPSFIAYK